MEASDRIDAAHEGRRGDDLQVVARFQRDDFLIDDELPDAGEIVFHGLQQVAARGRSSAILCSTSLMTLFSRSCGLKARVVVVIREVLLVQGQGDLEHFVRASS